MKLFRRDFIHALRTLIALICLLCIQRADAYFHHGYIAPVFGKSVQNMTYAGVDMFMNILSTAGSLTVSGNPSAPYLTNQQLPTGVLPGAYSGNMAAPSSYFGHYTMKWTGVGAFNISKTVPTLVYSGGASVFGVTPSNTGQYFGGPSFINTNGVNVEFSLGALIASVSYDGSNNVVLAASIANGFNNVTTGAHVQLNNITCVNGATGPNADGSWTVTNNSTISITLQASSACFNLVTVTGSGGAGVQSEVIVDGGGQISINWPTSVPGIGTITYSMSNMVLAQTPNMIALNAGQKLRPEFITAVTSLKPRWMRFMDAMNTQSVMGNFNDQLPIDAIGISGKTGWFTNKNGGTTAGAGDNYTVSNPADSGAGAYVNGEIVQFVTDRAPTGFNPTLKLGSRPTVPIYANLGAPIRLPVSGTPTSGDIISVIFTGTQVPGSPYTFQYTVTGADQSGGLSTLQGNFATALQNDNTLASIGFQFGNSGIVGGVIGYYAPGQGIITVSSSTSGAATETVSAGTVFSTTIANNTGYTAQYISLFGGFVLTGGALSTGMPVGIFKELCNRAQVSPWFATSLGWTQAAHSALGAYAAANFPGLTPVVEFSNETWNPGQNAYYYTSSLGVAAGFTATTGSNSFRAIYSYYALSVVNNLTAFASGYVGAGGTRSNMIIALEGRAIDPQSNPSNSANVPQRLNGQFLTTASTFTGSITTTTLTASSLSTNGAVLPGNDITGAGVTAGTKIVRQLTGVTGGNGTYTVNISQSASSSMTATNSIYAALGGPDGSATTTSYNQYPTRPVDLADALGYAVYNTGALLGLGTGTWSGTQSNYNALFQASADFATGVPASITSAFNAVDADLCGASSNVSTCGFKGATPNNQTINGYVGLGSFSASNNVAPGWEAIAASYDGAGRPPGKANLSMLQYEGGLQVSFNNGGNGTATADATTLNSQFTTNAWTLSPTYGASNLVVAQNMTALLIAYINTSPQFYATQLYLWQQTAAVHAARPIFAPAQYGVNGVGTVNACTTAATTLWGLYCAGIASPQNGAFLADQYYNTH